MRMIVRTLCALACTLACAGTVRAADDTADTSTSSERMLGDRTWMVVPQFSLTLDEHHRSWNVAPMLNGEWFHAPGGYTLLEGTGWYFHNTAEVADHDAGITEHTASLYRGELQLTHTFDDHPRVEAVQPMTYTTSGFTVLGRGMLATGSGPLVDGIQAMGAGYGGASVPGHGHGEGRPIGYRVGVRRWHYLVGWWLARLHVVGTGNTTESFVTNGPLIRVRSTGGPGLQMDAAMYGFPLEPKLTEYSEFVGRLTYTGESGLSLSPAFTATTSNHRDQHSPSKYLFTLNVGYQIGSD